MLGSWCECISDYYYKFDGVSPQVLAIAVKNLRQRKIIPTAYRLMKFLSSNEGTELTFNQSMRDFEMRWPREMVVYKKSLEFSPRATAVNDLGFV